MNGLLPELTWGTWDALAGAPTGSRDGRSDGGVVDERVGDRPVQPSTRARSRRKLARLGLAAPAQSQLWFEELLARVDATGFGRQRYSSGGGGGTCGDHDGDGDASAEAPPPPSRSSGGGLYHCNPLRCLHAPAAGAAPTTTEPVIPWDELPTGIHPRDGKLPPERIRRKRQQVENLAVFLQRLLRPGDVVVEFCAGSGYVALPLACLFPDCTFVVLDKKAPSLAIAEERIAAAGLRNVEIFCGFIDDYDKPFDVGIALHACGEATDMVLEKCLTAHAAFVLAPCCVGKIKLSALTYPRSTGLGAIVARHEFEVLARAADFGHTNDAMCLNPVNVRRRRCKSLLETDRVMRARERGYETALFVMHPHDATPKNDVLVGLPPPPPSAAVAGAATGTGAAAAAATVATASERRSLRLDCHRILDDDETRRIIFGLR